MKLPSVVLIASVCSVKAIDIQRNETSALITSSDGRHASVSITDPTARLEFESLQSYIEHTEDIKADKFWGEGYVTEGAGDPGCTKPSFAECEKYREDEQARLSKCHPPHSHACKKARRKSWKKWLKKCEPKECRVCNFDKPKCHKCELVCISWLLFWDFCVGMACSHGFHGPCCYWPGYAYGPLAKWDQLHNR